MHVGSDFDLRHELDLFKDMAHFHASEHFAGKHHCLAVMVYLPRQGFGPCLRALDGLHQLRNDLFKRVYLVVEEDDFSRFLSRDLLVDFVLFKGRRLHCQEDEINVAKRAKYQTRPTLATRAM